MKRWVVTDVETHSGLQWWRNCGAISPIASKHEASSFLCHSTSAFCISELSKWCATDPFSHGLTLGWPWSWSWLWQPYSHNLQKPQWGWTRGCHPGKDFMGDQHSRCGAALMGIGQLNTLLRWKWLGSFMCYFYTELECVAAVGNEVFCTSEKVQLKKLSIL